MNRKGKVQVIFDRQVCCSFWPWLLKLSSLAVQPKFYSVSRWFETRKKFDELTDDVSTFKILYFFCFVLYFNSHQRYFQLKGEWMYNCLWLIFKKCPGFCKKNASYLQMILFWSMLQSGMRIWNKNISRFCLNSRKRFKNIKLWIFLTTKNALKKLKKDKVRGEKRWFRAGCLGGFS